MADRELPWLDDRWRGARPPRFAASMRAGLDMGGPTAVWGVDAPLSERPCLLLRAASSSRRSRLSLLSRCLPACRSACRRRTASAILSVISSSCAVPIWFRSTPSDTSSSSTWRTRSSSTSSASRSEALSRERRLDWCSIARGGMTALDGDAPGGFWLADRLPLRLRSLVVRSLRGSRLALLLLAMPASLRLGC